ncbi:template-activating factor I [Nematocida ausubeli]|uniref:Template-activating factor I n=1 Tax=Nematocida ausubeli (strain ATCC PRA-371 / ERTm2) TaxID=1913371 RepID=H8ZCW4_NEMA1|nr:uncharacterized protein NESG_02371 [Nematocida ausubeli]EHY65504.1 hypothetical protein NERG_01111 [Nematocida ausubeli]KAI5134254.1 template-activating factor I [Nematocida ausubeli]KAI5137032.1 template-activating factor I [Nematocida ausubeli]KAI5147555.1 template-activating factor I [Nematocida ausubeli]KAI5163722.1 template-activating factor I [Nematocida ausubeli]
MTPEDALKALVNIQSKIDTANAETLKEEHNLKLSYFNSLKETMAERDTLIKEIDGFWEAVLCCSECAELLAEMDYREGQEETSIDISWIDEIIVEYREDFKYYVGIKAKENAYFKNTLLEKEFSLFEGPECISTQIEWKNKKLIENPLVRFFSSADSSDDDTNMAIFQLLSDIYFNAVYYYVRLPEDESDCCEHKH